MLREFWDRNQKGIIVAAGMLLFLTAGYIATSFPHQAKTQARSGNFIPKSEAEAEKKEEKAAALEVSAAAPVTDLPSEWILYITGAVRRPGVYKLPAGSRLLQLVSAAGGLGTAADPTAVNLAAFLEDGMHVHVPDRGEEQPARAAYIGVTPYVTAAGAQTNSPGGGTPKAGLPVDVNRASAEELTALKGIGPALAGNIVEYRLKNGRFNEVDDLLHVKGIGRKKLEQFRDAVVIRP